MYLDFFHFKQEPFSIAPDPRFLFMSEQHKEALAHLLYGVQSSGAFIVLSGEVGSGKTTVCRCFLEQIPEHVDVAFVLNPKLSAQELLASICDDLKVDYPEHASIKQLIDSLNRFLLENHAKGRDTLVVIEEAQNLSVDVLEQLRLLTNLETNEKKLLQIVLLAQPELLDILAKPEMKQLAQRITARFHLSPLSYQETSQYIQHRLNISGAKHDPFPANVKKGIYKASMGVPRLVNLLADRCLLGAYSQGSHSVSKKILRQALSELRGQKTKRPFSHILKLLIPLFLLVILLIGGAFWVYKNGISTRFDFASRAPLNSQSAEMPLNGSYQQASENLLSLWGLMPVSTTEIGNNQQLCQFAKIHQLSCYSDTANIGLLLKLGRPVILKLSADGLDYQYVVLKGQENGKLLIQDDEKQIPLSFQEFERYWLGDFIALVRTPPIWSGNIVSLGEYSAMTLWIKQILENLGYALQTSDGSYRETEMKIIKELQAQAGIYADGKVGLKTIIYLNTLSDKRIPRLLDMQSSNATSLIQRPGE